MTASQQQQAPLHEGQPQAYNLAAHNGPTYKTWSVQEGALKPPTGPSCCVKFKFMIWLAIVLTLIAAGVGLSVVMFIVQDSRNDNRPPSPPSPPTDNEGGSGAGSSGGGHTGPLPVPGAVPFTVPPGNQAIWWDEFDGDSLDTGKWRYDLGNGKWGWGNNEVESYTDSPDNVRVADGNLYITALQDGSASYTSGRLNTKSTAGFYPGMSLEDGTTFSTVHVEARMQLPSPGQGLWPAFWMFPTKPTYGAWAASGEIDVMESINEMTTLTQGLHFGGTAPRDQKNMTRTRQDGKTPFSDGFHVVAVDWSYNSITLSVDGVASKTFLPREKDASGWFTTAANAPADAPFNQPFYLILNLAVGGLWPGAPDSTTPFPATFTIDYVRAWGAP